MPAGDPTLFQHVTAIVNEYVVPTMTETLRLLPDSVIIGTALYSIISLCKSYGILLLTMVELMLIQRVTASVIGGIAPIGAQHDALHMSCQPGMAFSNTMRISLLETIGKPSYFPSPTMFFLAGIISYMIGSVKQFEREIKVLGGDLTTRTTISIVLSAALAFVMLIFRYSFGCESFETLLMSLIFGLIAGLVIVYQNKTIFGRDSLNILNLPMIQTAGESGKPMYVCGQS